MAAPICQRCGERSADLMVSLTATGATEAVCLPCTPGLVIDMFTEAGVPGLVFGIEDDDPRETDQASAEAQPDPEETPSEAPGASEATTTHLRAVDGQERPSGGRKRRSSGAGPSSQHEEAATDAGD